MAAGAVASAPTALQAREPNVVFILADDLGWSDTTLYGTTRFYQTPNIERLAKRGMTFTRAYSASPLCSPTRSAILTGLSPARTGITTPNGHLAEVVLEASVPLSAAPNQKAIQPKPPTRLKLDCRTLAEALKSAGYATGHFGKWHLGAEPYSPLQQGFDVDLPHHPGPGPAGSYVAPWQFKNKSFLPRTPHEHIEDRMADEAAAWMEQHRDQPFYLNYWMFSVHAPFNAKAELIDKHRPRVDPQDPQRSPTYAAMVESMDDAVGKLLDTLDRLKIADNTIIVFTSDNGGNMYNDIDGTSPTSNHPLRGGKATLFEGGTRVPAVIVWPNVAQPGSRSDVPIQSEDYYPTLLAGLGLAPAEGQRFDGVNILPALRGQSLPQRALFQYFPHSPGVRDWLPPCVSVHRDQWKLIRIFYGGDDGKHRYLLFNLATDPSETQNLATERPELVSELDRLIDTFLEQTAAVVPRPNPKFDPAKYDPSQEGKSQPKAKKKSSAGQQDENDPALKGWKVRGCQASVDQGMLRVRNTTAASFLGFAAGKHSGASQIKFRIKAQGPATAHIDWLPGGAGSKARQTPYEISRDGWQEVTVSIPADGPLGIVRLYLPSQAEPVELDWIELQSNSPAKTTRSDF